MGENTKDQKVSSELLNIDSSKGGMLLIKPNDKKKDTFQMPPSSVLSRVKDFLPNLAAANSQLDVAISQHGAEAVDIEHVAAQDRHIEMNLAFVDGLQSDTDSDSGLSEGDSDSEDSDPLFAEVSADNIKLPTSASKPAAQKPKIEVIEDITETDST